MRRTLVARSGCFFVVLSVKSPPSSELWGVNMTENSVVPFAPGDGLDKAGESILKLLHKAASVAEQNSQHALDMAQRLSHRAERAEQWLHKVYSEIEDNGTVTRRHFKLFSGGAF
jgi:hypothetical protein